MGKDPHSMGRSYLALPNTTESEDGEAELGSPLHSFTREPGTGSEPGRALGRRRIF